MVADSSQDYCTPLTKVVVALSEASNGDEATVRSYFARAFELREGLVPPPLIVDATAERRSYASNRNAAAAACSGEVGAAARGLRVRRPAFDSSLFTESCAGPQVVSFFDADDRMHPRRLEVTRSPLCAPPPLPFREKKYTTTPLYPFECT